MLYNVLLHKHHDRVSLSKTFRKKEGETGEKGRSSMVVVVAGMWRKQWQAYKHIHKYMCAYICMHTLIPDRIRTHIWHITPHERLSYFSNHRIPVFKIRKKAHQSCLPRSHMRSEHNPSTMVSQKQPPVLFFKRSMSVTHVKYPAWDHHTQHLKVSLRSLLMSQTMITMGGTKPGIKVQENSPKEKIWCQKSCRTEMRPAGGVGVGGEWVVKIVGEENYITLPANLSAFPQKAVQQGVR